MCSYDELDTLLNENWIANSSARQLTFDREEIKPILKEYRLKQIYEKKFSGIKATARISLPKAGKFFDISYF